MWPDLRRFKKHKKVSKYSTFKIMKVTYFIINIFVISISFNYFFREFYDDILKAF